jgi:hypothetical protein
LGLRDRSAKHENVATECGCLKRRVQQELAGDLCSKDVEGMLTEIRESFDGLSRATPQVAACIWEAALRKVPLEEV